MRLRLAGHHLAVNLLVAVRALDLAQAVRHEEAATQGGLLAAHEVLLKVVVDEVPQDRIYLQIAQQVCCRTLML